jgi:hypothetical protein
LWQGRTMYFVNICCAQLLGDKPDRRKGPPKEFCSAVICGFLNLVPVASWCTKGIITCARVYGLLQSLTCVQGTKVTVEKLHLLSAQV